MKLNLKNVPFVHFKGNLKKKFTKFELPVIFLVIFRSNLYLFLIFLYSKRQIKNHFFDDKIKAKGKLNKS